MRATIKKELNTEQRIKFVLDCIKNIYGFSPLKEIEQLLLIETFNLPEAYKNTPTPFSLTMRKIYQKNLKLTSTQLMTMIKTIAQKGYLKKDDYGEFIIKPSIKKLLESETLSITFEINNNNN